MIIVGDLGIDERRARGYRVRRAPNRTWVPTLGTPIFSLMMRRFEAFSTCALEVPAHRRESKAGPVVEVEELTHT